jgi:KDO2-lipid IV(A) lauroyltransferase
MALGFGSVLGWIAWRLLRIRRAIVLKNLKQAFPDWDDSRLDRTGLRSYMNSGRFMMEFSRQDRMDAEFIKSHVSVNDSSALEALRNTGGALIITGHFGNWELLGIAFKYLLGDVSFLVGRQSNGLVDDFINRMRSMHGIELYNRRSAVKGVLDSIRRGGYVCWLSDQDAGENGVTVDFFGYPASTPRGAAAFSVKLGIPVVPAVMVRDGKGPDHTLVIGHPVLPDTGLSKPGAEERLTQDYTKQLEGMISKYPDLYWWAHRRWKSTGFYSGKGKIRGS